MPIEVTESSGMHTYMVVTTGTRKSEALRVFRIQERDWKSALETAFGTAAKGLTHKQMYVNNIAIPKTVHVYDRDGGMDAPIFAVITQVD